MSALSMTHPAGFAFSTGYTVIKGLYQVIEDINVWINDHIQEMKHSENSTISRAGRVLEGAKHGFGLGYIAPVVIITLGQFLCGFTVAALTTVGTAATFSNPIVNTCAALGAVYYGWNALTNQEKNDTIERIKADLGVGVEMVKAVVSFVFAKIKELLSSGNLQELKNFIAQSAKSFGRTLADVTGAIKDRVVDAYQKVKTVVGEAGGVAKEHTEGALNKLKMTAEDVGSSLAKGSLVITGGAKGVVTGSLKSLKRRAKPLRANADDTPDIDPSE